MITCLNYCMIIIFPDIYLLLALYYKGVSNMPVTGALTYKLIYLYIYTSLPRLYYILSVALCIHALSHFIGFLCHFLTCVGTETLCSTLILLQWIRSRTTRSSGTPRLASKCSSPMGRWAVWEYTRQCNITQVIKKENTRHQYISCKPHDCPNGMLFKTVQIIAIHAYWKFETHP